jgi:23S rRNA (adenine-N6)-dimethyltransferase
MSKPVRRPTQQALSYHRLRDAAAERIVASTGLAPPDLVFDLGAGDGQLTAALRHRCRRVVAVELDRERWSALRARFRDDPGVEAVLGNFLAMQFPRQGRYAVVSNVPFAATSALLRKLQRLPNPPQSAYLVVQAEAALRWAGMGCETQSSVLLKVQYHADILLALRRTDYEPRPAVDAVLLQLRRRQRPLVASHELSRFEAFLRREFGNGRHGRGRPSERTAEEWMAAYLGSRSWKPAATRSAR